MKGNTVGIKRLMKEHKDILDNPNENFVAEPDPDNIFHWHYCIYKLKNCPYEGGYYHGMLKFPNEYPMKPPAVLMLTPSGRFECNERICLSISDWHPESWNPVWKVESIIIGLLSFMMSDDHSVASLHLSEAERKKFAKESLQWNMKKNPSGRFEQIFEKHLVRLGIREGKIEEPPKKAVAAPVEQPPGLKRTASKKEEEEEKKGAPVKVEEAPKPDKRGAKKEEPVAQIAAAPDQKKRGAKEEEKKQNQDNKA